MSDVIIRPPEHGEGTRLAELYRMAFSGYTRRIPRPDASNLFLVAEYRGEIVGVGGLEVGKPTHDLESLLRYLAPLVRAAFEPLDDAPPVRVEAPLGYRPRGTPSDAFLTALAVEPTLRRQGIGTRLTRGRLHHALKRGARQAWVTCVAGSGSRELYETLGFTPLVTLQRRYRGGQGMTLLHADHHTLERAASS
jgi:GNAT superfamily N-acetyltransferase